MSANSRRYYVNASSFLEPAELEVDESARIVPPPPTTARKGFSEIMLEPVEFNFSDAVLAGPAMALRLSVQFAPGVELAGCQQEFVALLHALDAFDQSLGGLGLVVDSSLSGGTVNTLTVVLRPLDVRWSLDRFTQMANLLGIQPVSRAVEQPPAHLNGEYIAAVTSLFTRRGPVDAQSARDRVQDWRGRQRWLAGLQVELVQPR